MADRDRDDSVDAPPAGESIHMPAPSIIPIINAVGLSIAIIAIPLSIYAAIVGLLVFLITAAIWIRDSRREMDALPMDHHAGH
jgi:hypothetical protein